MSKEHEDRMESFVLSETLKYLYLLFDEGTRPVFDTYPDNPLHHLDSNFVFTTEGHPIHLPNNLHQNPVAQDSAATCQVPEISTSLFSQILSIPDAFHPFTPNTTLDKIFSPFLDTNGISTPRSVLEVTSASFNPYVFRNLISFFHIRMMEKRHKRQRAKMWRRCPVFLHYEQPKVSTSPI